MYIYKLYWYNALAFLLTINLYKYMKRIERKIRPALKLLLPAIAFMPMIVGAWGLVSFMAYTGYK